MATLRVVTPLKDTKIAEGGWAVLSLELNDILNPEQAKTCNVVWRKDKTPIDVNNAFKYHSYCSLGLVSLQIINFDPKLDSGLYECLVTSSSAGSVTSYCRVSAVPKWQLKAPTAVFSNKPVTFLKPLKDIKVKENQKLILTVTLSEAYMSTPVDQSEFSWFFNNEPITTDEETSFSANHVSSSRLVILNVKQLNEGHYSVQWNELKSFCRVSVLPSLASINIPNFLRALPKETKLVEGQKATFEVIVKGKPFPEVTWSLDDVSLTSSDRVSFSNDDKSGECSLELASVSSKDSGKKLTCSLKSDKGKADCISMLTVEPTATRKVEIKNPSPNKLNSLKKIVFDAIDENEALQSESPITSKSYSAGSRTLNTPGDGKYLEIVKPLEITSSNSGLITLACVVEGEPKPQISWYKNANILRKSKTTEFLFDGKTANLLIKPDDSGCIDEIAGAYTCRAENMFEQKQTSINISKTSLNSLSLKNTGTGNGESSGHSTIDRHARTPSTSSMPTATIGGKQSTESLVSNDSRALTTPASVGLKKKGGAMRRTSSAVFLRLLSPLQDQEVKIGDSLNLSCTISCSERPVIFWYLDGEELDLDDTENVYNDGKCLLMLKNVDKLYEGVYECIIQSGQTEITSCCSVKVKDPNEDQPRMILPWEDMEILVGDPVSLYAQYWPDNATVKWFKNSVELLPSFYSVDQGSSQLTLQNMMETSEVSIVVSSPGSGKTASNKCRVIVHAIPIEITSKTADSSFAVGESCSFFVEFNCESKVTAEWFQNGKLKSNSSSLTIITADGKSQVVIQKFSKDLAGQWTCVLSDDFVSLQHSFNVSIAETKTKPQSPLLKLGNKSNSKPIKFLKSLENCSVKEGKTLKLECQLSQNISNPNVAWYHESTRLTNSDYYVIRYVSGVASLTVASIKATAAGHYTCNVTLPSGEEISTKCLVKVPKDSIAKPPIKDGSKPVLKAQSKKQSNVKAGKAFELSCEVIGSPQPSVKWLHNGVQFSSSSISNGVSKISISSAKDSDAGVYECFATNDLGEAKSEFSVEVESNLDKPVFARKPENTEVKEGKPLKLSAKITSSSKLKVSWFVNGTEVENGKNGYKTTGSDQIFTLNVANVISDVHVGTFECRAENESGCSVATCQVKVLAKPTIVKPLQDVFVAPNSSVLLECHFSAQSTPKAVWYKNGTRLFQVKNVKTSLENGIAKLEISNFLAGSAGTYLVKIANNEGEVSSSCKVDVYRQPTFKKHLSEKIDAILGKTLKLECIIEGVGESDIVWYHNETVLSPKTYQFEKGNVASLTFDSCSEQHAGIYTCVASHTGGSALSTCTVNICSLPEITPLTFCESLELVSADTLKLSVQVLGKPSPSLQWFFKDSLIQDKPGITLTQKENTYELNVKSVTTQNSGDYLCVAKNTVGIAKLGCLVSVVASGKTAQFSKMLENVTVKEGSVLKLETAFNAFGSFSSKWFSDSHEVKETQAVKITDKPTSSCLTIENAEKCWSGTFLYEVVNRFGRSATSCNVVVLFQPSFTKKLDSHFYVSRKSASTMEVHFEGQPAPEVVWTRDEETLEATEGIKIHSTDTKSILHILEPTGGKYTCTLSNEIGSVSSTCQVVVMDVPKFEKPLQDKEAKDGDDVTLECTIIGFPPPEVSWFFNEKKLKSDDKFVEMVSNDTYTLLIKKTSKSNHGTYKIVASNQAGMNTQSCSLKVCDIPEILCLRSKITEEEEISVEENDEFEIDFSVKVKSDPVIRWFFKDQPIVNSIRVQTKLRAGVAKLYITKCTAEDSGEYSIVVKSSSDGTQRSQKFFVQVYTKPNFQVPMKKTMKVITQQELILECKVSGFPEPMVFWYHNDEILEDNDRRSIEYDNGLALLKINSCFLEDSGVYNCKAINTVATTTCSCDVNIYSLPEFIQGLSDIVVEKGKNIELVCKVSAHPPPTVKWYQKGRELRNSNDIHVSHTGDEFSLVIKNSKFSHAAEYTCKAANIVGEASSQCFVEVGTLPLFKQELKKMTDIISGNKLVLQIEYSSRPIPAVKWFRDGTELSVEDEENCSFYHDEKSIARLTYDPVNIDQQGFYECVIENVMSSAKCDCRVFVYSVPKFVENLEDLELVENEDLVLRCKVIGYPEPKVAWSFNSKEVDDLNNEDCDLEYDDGVAVLKISKVKRSYSGTFSCKAFNSAGEYTSECKVDVMVLPTFLEFPSSKDVEIDKGNNFEIEAKFEGVPLPSVAWFKNDVRLEQSGNCSINVDESHANLKVVNCQADDSGSYKCCLTNKLSTVSRQLNILILSPPVINFDKDVLNLKSNEPFSIAIPVEGSPKPSIVCTVNKKPITKFPELCLNESEFKLDIKNVKPELAGLYSFEVENKIGKVSLDLKVNVLCPPSFLTPLEGHQVNIGDDLYLLVVLNPCYPVPKMTWKHNDRPLVVSEDSGILLRCDGDQYMLIREDVSFDFAGEYLCQISNSQGKAECRAKITVEELLIKPKIERALRDVFVDESKPLEIVCHFAASPKPVITWFRDSQPISESSDEFKISRAQKTATLKLDSAMLIHSGSYMVKLVNKAGECQSVFKISVKELIIKPKILQPLKDLSTIEFETVVLQCEFEAKPTPEITWYFNNVALTKRVIGMTIESNASESKLILENVGVKKAGNYKCRVKNKSGMASSACKLDVEVKPIPPGLVMDDKMEVTELSDITIKCLVEGNPFPGIKWFRNDKALTDTKYYDMYVNSGGVACLGFREVRISDAGIYQCQATNAYGEARTDISLRVNFKPVKPEFRKPLANKIVREGQPCVMTCEITGYPVPEIACFHEGYELDNDSHVQISFENEVVTLSIEKTELDHAGMYSVRATNDVDSSSSKAKLTVQAAPKTKPVFETQMENCEAVEGDSVVLSNKISAHPSPNISWLLGGRKILNSKNQELKFAFGVASLTIKKVMKTQAGEYTCIASNSEGETRVSCVLTTTAIRDENSRRMTLGSLGNFDSSPPQLVRELKDIVCQEGQNITLECGFVAKHVTIEWKLNGEVLKPSEDFVMSRTEEAATLQIRNTKMINEGQITVALENPAGKVESSCQVSVGVLPEKNVKNVPPHFIKPLQDIDVEDGSRVVLECKVGGPEPIEVHWLFAGEELQSHGDFKITYQFGVARLEILEVFPEDCGDYLCLARNDFGHVKTECFVNVLEAEEILKSSEDSSNSTKTPEKPILIKELPEELIVVDGDPLILEVKVKCHPDPDVVWFYNGEAIETTEYLTSTFQDGIAQLRFEDIYPTDAGLYECRIQNDLGFVTSSCLLSVDEEMKTEEILIQLQQSYSNENFRAIKSPSRNSSGSIRESPSSNNMSTLNVHQWTIDKSLKMRKQLGKPSVLIGELQDSDFVPSISNVKSDKPPFLVKKLRDLNVEHAEAFKMECKISHRSDAEVAWFLNGVQVKSNDNVLITFADKIAMFEVLKATPDLSGEIMCKAINQMGEVSSKCQIKVFPKMRVAPQFQTELFDLTCEEQDNLTLQCELDCDSETEVEWYFNDRALPKFSKDIKMTFENAVAKLDIVSAMVLDSGRYTCEAFNSVGESYSWCDVCVQEVVSGLSPVFVEKLTNKTVMEGEPCELFCSLQEYRGVEVKWLLNGKPLAITKDMEVIQDGNDQRIVFTKTRVSNAGKYTCKAIGRSSSTWTGCEVTVGGVPKFVSKLENAKFQISDDLYLQCELIGHPTPHVSWYHNKKPVKVMRNYNTGYQGQKAWLRVEKVEMKHAGEYICKINNSFGEAMSICEVGVGASPGFLEELEDILVVTDKPFQLVCEISGVPSPYIEWYHPDEHNRLKVSRNVRTKFIDGTATLLIDRATEEMAGIYHCKALNSFGKAVSTCKVTIGSLPEVLTNIEDQNVIVGETVKFECMFSSESNPIVVWLLNGCNVVGTEGVTQDIGSDWASLTLTACTESQAGEYMCKIVNDFGEVLSKANLTVGSPPNFTKKPRDIVKLSEGKALKLIAEIEGSPKPSFEWSFNERPIGEVCPAAKITSRDNILFLDIDKITSALAGKYMCVLKNNFGVEQSITKVIIGCSPEFSSEFPSQLRVNIGEALVIKCEYNAFPEPEVFWFKDKRQLAEKAGEIEILDSKSNVSELKYFNAKAGLYAVKLKNNYGEISGECKVEVGGKPVVSKALKNERLTEGMSCKIQCEITSLPEAQISWFINGVSISKYSRDHKLTSKEGKICLEIHRVSSFYFGEHQVKAVNMFGETTTSCEVENALLAKKLTTKTLEKPDKLASVDKNEALLETKSHTIARSTTTISKNSASETEVKKKEVCRSLSDSKSSKQEEEKGQEKGKGIPSSVDNAQPSEKLENADRTPKEKRKFLDRKPSVKEAKPSFSKELPSNVSLKVGDKLELLCLSLFEISPQTEVIWYHNGAVVRPFLGIEISGKGNECTLSISNVKLRHSGRYECKLSNKMGQAMTACEVSVALSPAPAAGSSKSSALDLSKQDSMLQLTSDSEAASQITKKPIFTRKLNDARLFGGDNLKLECSVTGYPEPTIKWFRDSQRLPEFGNIENGKVVLEIANVTTQHAGIYMCKASNVAGGASCTCRVTITGTLRRRNSLMTKSKATLLETTAENAEASKSGEFVGRIRESKEALASPEARKKKTLSCLELKDYEKDARSSHSPLASKSPLTPSIAEAERESKKDGVEDGTQKIGVTEVKPSTKSKSQSEADQEMKKDSTPLQKGSEASKKDCQFNNGPVESDKNISQLSAISKSKESKIALEATKQESVISKKDQTVEEKNLKREKSVPSRFLQSRDKTEKDMEAEKIREKNKAKAEKKPESKITKTVEKTEVEFIKSKEKPEIQAENSVKKSEIETEKGVKKLEPETAKSVKKSETETTKSVKKSETETVKSVKKLEMDTEKDVKEPETKTPKSVKKSETETTKSVKKSETETVKSVKKSEPDTIKGVKKSEMETEKGVKKLETETAKNVKKLEMETEKDVKKSEIDTAKILKKSETETEKNLKKSDAEISKGVKEAETETQKGAKNSETDTEKDVKKPKVETNNSVKKSEIKNEKDIRKTETETQKGMKKSETETQKGVRKQETEPEKESKKLDAETEKSVIKNELDKPKVVKPKMAELDAQKSLNRDTEETRNEKSSKIEASLKEVIKKSEEKGTKKLSVKEKFEKIAEKNKTETKVDKNLNINEKSRLVETATENDAKKLLERNGKANDTENIHKPGLLKNSSNDAVKNSKETETSKLSKKFEKSVEQEKNGAKLEIKIDDQVKTIKENEKGAESEKVVEKKQTTKSATLKNEKPQDNASKKALDTDKTPQPDSSTDGKDERSPSSKKAEKLGSKETESVNEPKFQLLFAEESKLTFNEEKCGDLKLKRPKKITCDVSKCRSSCCEKCKCLNSPKVLIAPNFEAPSKHPDRVKKMSSLDESDQCSTPTQLSRASSRKDVMISGSKQNLSVTSSKGNLSPFRVDTSQTTTKASKADEGANAMLASDLKELGAPLMTSAVPQMPFFTLKLTDVSVQLAKDISLICRVKGVPKPEIIWCKDGRVLRNGYKHKMLEDAGLNILEIRGVKLDDAATYTCKARNNQGQAVSECCLKVAVVHKNCIPMSPPMFLRPVLDIVVAAEGHAARFECQVHAGSNTSEISGSISSSINNISEPSLEICWFKDEDLIVVEGNCRYKLDCSRSGFYALLIDDIGEDDVGTYYCIATNSNGQRIFSAANLTIDTSSYWQTGHLRADMDDEKSVADSFATCDDAKSLVSTSTDMHSCVTGATGHHSRRRGSTNSMQSAFSDTTSITSEGDFPGGMQFPGGSILGEMPTYNVCEFVTKPQGGVYKEGSTVELTANVSGYPLPVIEWFRNGKLLKSGGRMTISEDPTSGKGTLRIRECDLTDAGEYTVAANNTVNAIYAVINVSIQECEEDEEEGEEKEEDDYEDGTETEEGEDEDSQDEGTPGEAIAEEEDDGNGKQPENTSRETKNSSKDSDQAFFGSKYDKQSKQVSGKPSVPEIHLLDTTGSPGFFETREEDSPLVNEIFETLKMNKRVSPQSADSSGYPSSISTALNRSRDLDSMNSPAANESLTPGSMTKEDSLNNVDDVFAEKKSASGENKKSTSKLSPDASPPTRERPVSPRMKSNFTELPKVPPEILQPLADLTVSSGCLVTLECTFSLPLPDTIKWFRNNELVQTNHSISFKNDAETGKSSLTIHSVIPMDEGIYEVLGKNVLGEIQSSAFLKVDANQLRRISESDEDTMCESVKTDDGSNTVVDSSCSASRRVSITSNVVSSLGDSSSALAPDASQLGVKELMSQASVRGQNIWEVIMSHHDADNNLRLSKGEQVIVIDDSSEKWVIRHAQTLALGCVPAYILKSSENLSSKEMSPNTPLESMFQLSPKSRDSEYSSIPDVVLSEIGEGGAASGGGSSGVDEYEVSHVRKRKPNQNDSNSSETDDRTSGEFFELYRAIANYQPASGRSDSSADKQRAESSDDSIWLSEGQFVEVLDNSNAKKWMVRTKASKNSPVRVGWVPSSFLEKVLDIIELKRPGSWNFDSESSEAAQQTLKKQTSISSGVTDKHHLAKRVASSASNLHLGPTQNDEMAENKLKLAIQELFTTEEAYVSDLSFIVDKFMPALKSPNLPVPLREKGAQQKLFLNIEEIYKFNSTKLLPDLRKYKSLPPEAVGNCFLHWQESFEMYVEYCQHKESAHKVLSVPAVKLFFDDHLRKLGVKMDLGTYLIKPVQRITKYHLVLKEILKYASKLKRDTCAIEKALAVMIELPAKANNLMQIDSIVDCPFGLEKVGPLIMIDDVTVWESKPRTQGKERTLFLFRHMILFTKKKQERSTSASPIYCYKKHMQVAGVGINFKDKDDKRRFELYMGRREVTTNFSIIQAKSFYKKEAWVKEILTLQAKDNEEIQDMRSKAKRRTRMSEPIPAHIASGFDSLYRKIGESKEPDTLMDDAEIGSVFGVVLPCGPGFHVGDNVEVIDFPSPQSLFSPSISRKTSTVDEAPIPSSSRKSSTASRDERGVWVRAISGSKVGETAQITRDCLTKHQQVVDDAMTPQFKKVVKDQEVFEGQFVELDVIVDQTVTSISWLKDDDELTRTSSAGDLCRKEEGRLAFESNFATGEHKMAISECVMSDSGQYKCTAESSTFVTTCSANLTVYRVKTSIPGETTLSQRLSNTLKRTKKSKTAELPSTRPKISRAASTNLSEISARPKLLVSPSEDESASPSPSSIDILNSPTESPGFGLLHSQSTGLSSSSRKISAFLETSLSRFKANRHVSDDNLSQSATLHRNPSTGQFTSTTSPLVRQPPRRAETLNMGSEYIRKPRRKMGSVFDLS